MLLLHWNISSKYREEILALKLYRNTKKPSLYFPEGEK